MSVNPVHSEIMSVVSIMLSYVFSPSMSLVLRQEGIQLLTVVVVVVVVVRLHHIPMVKTIVFANIIIILSLFLPKRSLADKRETYTGMDPKLS